MAMEHLQNKVDDILLRQERDILLRQARDIGTQTDKDMLEHLVNL
jgi:hypothetical protein